MFVLQLNKISKHIISCEIQVIQKNQSVYLIVQY